MALPQKVFYGLACFTADIYWMFVPKDRSEVKNNLRAIIGPGLSDKDLSRMAKKVCRNFAKYLADFFSVSKIDADYVAKFVRVIGRHNIDAALAKGRGAIILSAHLGNWELGGSVLSRTGYPLNVVALTHRNEKMNALFTGQRLAGKMKPIEIGLSLRTCYKVLKGNGLVAILGDVDFMGNGLPVDFFGNKRFFPKGPAVLSYRIGSAVIPSFMIREEDDAFRLIIERPIYPDRNIDEEKAVLELTKKYVSRIEFYIARYPDQWCIFEDMWDRSKSRMSVNYRTALDSGNSKKVEEKTLI
jgi:KDO2-lipid IV(A) lauroyltransferase